MIKHTASGLYAISNATRYNTDDIVALFDDSVKSFEAEGYTVTHAHMDTPLGTIIDISDFKPSIGWETVRKYDAESNEYAFVRERVYVKRRGYTLVRRFKVGLLPPERLYDNPLEALVESGDDQRAPEGLVAGLVHRFFDLVDLQAPHTALYDWTERDRILRSIATRNSAAIRIMKKRGEVDLKERILREKRLEAKSSLNTNSSTVRDAWHNVYKAHNAAMEVERLCRAAGMDLKFDTQPFEQCITYLDRVIKGMEQMQEMSQDIPKLEEE